MIKKIFSTLALIAITLSFAPFQVSAQVQCPEINDNNYNQCCVINLSANKLLCDQATPPPPPADCSLVTDTNFATCCPNLQSYSRQCNNYLTGGNTTEGTIGSGTQNTNPQNGGSGTASGTVGTAPQSNAAALKSCSAIRFDSFLDILIWLKCIIGVAIIPLIFVVAFIFFLRGVLMFMYNADNEKKKEESKLLMIYGVIGLAVMVGVWGIVNIVNTTFGFGNTVPQLQSDCLTTDKNNPCKK
jgi:hypothetical protein